MKTSLWLNVKGLIVHEFDLILKEWANLSSFYMWKTEKPIYLPDMKTASYCPRPAAATRCFNLFSDGRTSKAGGSETIPNIVKQKKARESNILCQHIWFNEDNRTTQFLKFPLWKWIHIWISSGLFTLCEVGLSI